MAEREKWCATCGRRFAWRAKWAGVWDDVRYCSEGCRRERPGRLDAEIERVMEALIEARGAGKSICPSEVARAVRPDDWRALMERVRRAARRLAVAGRVVMTQGGRVVDPSAARGAVRIRRG
ncbi:MAG: DUF2256 and DUF3253 domain-containing protein [Myxococcales bacterium]|nr:DUF2256 and DUF3253 domain-containing protein [Myxococcales bacterium]MCB9552447.1 DUF2256 and DUF3253 domain-containing protein [Myxococcales bacterium]